MFAEGPLGRSLKTQAALKGAACSSIRARRTCNHFEGRTLTARAGRKPKP